MKNTKLGVIIGFVVLISGALAVFYSLKNTVENNEKAVIEYKGDIVSIKKDMGDVKIDIRDVKRIVKEDKKHKEQKDKEQVQDIKTALEEVLKAQAADRKPRRR